MNAFDLASRSFKKLVVAGVGALSFLPFFGVAQTAPTVDLYSALPPTAVDASTPLVMFAMSRDNQLWHKAYNDYSDLDGDDALDITYKDSFEYYGYFHSDFCYNYDEAAEVFRPIGGVIAGGGHRCAGSWSGNFMNWLTTTRIDVVRKVLYGGSRYADTADSTILQRAFIPSDNHAFVKLVDNADFAISDFTPITGQNSLSFCNVTDIRSGMQYIARDVNRDANPPLLKLAIGKQITWAGGELAQCLYNDQNASAYAPPRPASGAISGVPSNSTLVVRVEVCVDGQDRDDSEACQRYGEEGAASASYKPYGLLQTYGETGRYRFGLITGSYERNASGGVLRKNISLMGGDGVEAGDEGDREINPNNGIFLEDNTVAGAARDPGIINTLEAFRIYGWDFQTFDYIDCTEPGITEASFLDTTNAITRCRDWGNPISEIYLEALRYIANPGGAGGIGPSPDFFAASTDISGLSTATWEPVYDPQVPCSKCSVIMLSTGLNNYDGDDLDSSTSLPSLATRAEVSGFTDAVGAFEGINGNDFIVGRTAAGATPECTSKTVAGLSNASGPCPEVPALRGTYEIAGLAYYAHQTDLRPSLEGEQRIKTASISLAESLPDFFVESGSADSGITFTPICQTNSGEFANPAAAGWFPCSLVDLTVIQSEVSDPSVYQRYLISWEDSPWGNDYDMDSYAVIEICTAIGSATEVRNSCETYTNNLDTDYGTGLAAGLYNYSQHAAIPQWGSAVDGDIQMRMSLVANAAGFSMRMGYSITGAGAAGAGYDSDGVYSNEIVRHGNRFFNSVADAIPGATGGDPDAVIWSPGIRKFRGGSAGSSSPLLQNPLWYAAKYGNFRLPRGVQTPNVDFSNAVWDEFDLEGNPSPDGIPDGYFPVKNPAELPNALSRILSQVIDKPSAGSAAAVSAQTGSGEGAVYQALYTPVLQECNAINSGGEQATWVGMVNALFLDGNNNLREDFNGNGQLDPADMIVDFVLSYVDANGRTIELEKTHVQRYQIAADGGQGAPIGLPFEFCDDQYRPLWSAHEVLGDLSNAQLRQNRSSYAAAASAGRYIFTAIDRDDDGSVLEPDVSPNNPGSGSSDDVVFEFETANFSASGSTLNDVAYLGFDPDNVQQASVDDLVEYIRGVEGITGFRSRTVAGERNLIGDIVHSSPSVVGRPSDRYDLRFNDNAYAEFFRDYRDRRNVLYVGANDGMLHAFNAGFYNPTSNAFETGTPAHPLGAELWSYIPFNLLPHLQWLTSPQYPHVYYVDGPVQTFDVNIFTPSPTYPSGWGTILVATMRFGGGDYPVDHDNDASTPDKVLRSSVIVMDITDPESPPNLLAEISIDDLGFTSARPTVIKRRQPSTAGDFRTPQQNDWFLVLGSGPAGADDGARALAVAQGVSDQTAQLYTVPLDLDSADFGEPSAVTWAGAPDQSFVGGFEVADWDGDYQDDVVYFGTVGGTVAAPTGSMYRGVLNFAGNDVSISVSRLLNVDLPFEATPSTVRRSGDEFWVHVGSGRLMSPADNLTNQQQQLFGVKELMTASGPAGLITETALADVSDIVVFENGQLGERSGGTNVSVSASGTTLTVERFDEVDRFIQESAQGWRIDYQAPISEPLNANRPDSRIRSNTKPTYAGLSLVNSAYRATGDSCDTFGDAFLYTPHFAVGLPSPFGALGLSDDRTVIDPDGNTFDRALEAVKIGTGAPSDPALTRNSDGDYVVITQSGAAEISKVPLGRQPTPPGRKSWREIPVDWR